MYRTLTLRLALSFRLACLVGLGSGLGLGAIAAPARTPAPSGSDAAVTSAPGQAAAKTVAVDPITLGVYYYPGWFRSAWTMPQIWDPIRTIGDRTPILGWYDPRSVPVMRQQLAWMRDYGLDYVAFDWTFSHGAEHLGEPIDAYMAVDQSAVKLALLWANHDEPTTPADMQTIVRLWLSRYMRSDRYLTVDGKPVVFLFSFQKFRDDARASGSSAAAYIAEANWIAREAGLPGLYLVGGVDDTSADWLAKEARTSGISAISSYNFHRKPEAERPRDSFWWKPFHGYAALDTAYRAQWAAARALPVPFVVAMSSGWDKRPWGGSDDPAHDRSIGSNTAFRAHLAAGRRAILAANPKGGLGVLCCWNEFGEGSFVEPTRQDGFGKLDQIRAVFDRPPG